MRIEIVEFFQGAESTSNTENRMLQVYPQVESTTNVSRKSQQWDSRGWGSLCR